MSDSAVSMLNLFWKTTIELRICVLNLSDIRLDNENWGARGGQGNAV